MESAVTPSHDRKIAWAMAASVFGRAIGLLTGLLLIPLLYRHLQAEEVGLWFLLAQPTILLGLLDLGLTPVLTRRIALLTGVANDHRLQSVVATARKLYAANAILILVVCGLMGPILIGSLELQVISSPSAIMIWAVAATGYAIQAHAGRWIGVLAGRGHVAELAMIQSLCRGLALAIKAIVILAGGRLLSIVVIDALTAVVLDVSTRVVAKKLERNPDWFRGGRFDWDLWQSLRPLAMRSWLTTLGAFMILQTDQYFIAVFMGASYVPDYQSSLLVFHQMHQVALVASVCSGVFLSQMWAAGQFAALHRRIERNIDLAMAATIGGSTAVLLAAEPMFATWLGEGHFIGYPILIVIAITLVLETHHVVLASATLATDDEAFAAPAMIAGGINLVLTAWWIGPFGWLGVASATMVAQGLTNNWYAVVRAHRRLGISLRRHLTHNLAVYIIYFGVLLLGPMMSRSIGLDLRPNIAAIMSTVWCAVVTLGFLGLRTGKVLGSRSIPIVNRSAIVQPIGRHGRKSITVTGMLPECTSVATGGVGHGG